MYSITTSLHWEIKANSQMTIDFRLDGNFFNLRRHQATTKVILKLIFGLQYAEVQQAILSAVVNAYRRIGYTITGHCQYTKH